MSRGLGKLPNVQDGGAVGEGCRPPRVATDFAPFTEALVGRERQAAGFVSGTNRAEKYIDIAQVEDYAQYCLLKDGDGIIGGAERGVPALAAPVGHPALDRVAIGDSTRVRRRVRA